jgi:hypothetical protein
MMIACRASKPWARVLLSPGQTSSGAESAADAGAARDTCTQTSDVCAGTVTVSTMVNEQHAPAEHWIAREAAGLRPTEQSALRRRSLVRRAGIPLVEGSEGEPPSESAQNNLHLNTRHSHPQPFSDSKTSRTRACLRTSATSLLLYKEVLTVQTHSPTRLFRTPRARCTGKKEGLELHTTQCISEKRHRPSPWVASPSVTTVRASANARRSATRPSGVRRG